VTNKHANKPKQKRNFVNGDGNNDIYTAAAIAAAAAAADTIVYEYSGILVEWGQKQ